MSKMAKFIFELCINVVYPNMYKENKNYSKINLTDFNPIQRGVFFANRKRGGGGIYAPPVYFQNFFPEPPLNNFFRYLFYWLNGVLGHI